VLSSIGICNYFYHASLPTQGNISNAPIPYHTVQVSSNVVYHLSRDPAICQSSLDTFATQFTLPDLGPALHDFATCLAQHPGLYSISGHRLAGPSFFLPIPGIEVWTSLRLQNCSYFPPNTILSPVTLNVHPPSVEWSYGRYDTAIFNNSPAQNWPQSGLHGKYKLMNILLLNTYPT
jgi:hypothetical protein